jgi:hypothetical protein
MQELKYKRVAAGVKEGALRAKAGICRSGPNSIEQAGVSPWLEGTIRISEARQQLIEAKSAGWAIGSVR